MSSNDSERAPRATRSFEPWCSLALLAALPVLALARSGPPLPTPIDAPEAAFSGARARAARAGVVGARACFAEQGWARDASIALNREGRGTCGPSEMCETGDDNARWMETFGRVVPRPAAVSLAYEVYKRMPNDTDMTVFKRAGLAGF